jgi:hypothetical protein
VRARPEQIARSNAAPSTLAMPAASRGRAVSGTVRGSRVIWPASSTYAASAWRISQMRRRRPASKGSFMVR